MYRNNVIKYNKITAFLQAQLLLKHVKNIEILIFFAHKNCIKFQIIDEKKNSDTKKTC